MKTPSFIASCLLAALLPSSAQPASKGGPSVPRARTSAPVYKEEAPLPAGWPAPGPFGQVVTKRYPAYRAAFTPDSSTSSGFRRLFKHISRNKIPMTAPVGMTLDDSGTMPMEEMAFLYQSTDVGKTGTDGDLVEVRDMPAVKVLAYTWQGARNPSSISKARAALDAELTRRKLSATGYRLFGYNSPFIPRSKQTHELQAILR